jgi:hypothetical protein
MEEQESSLEDVAYAAELLRDPGLDLGDEQVVFDAIKPMLRLKLAG